MVCAVAVCICAHKGGTWAYTPDFFVRIRSKHPPPIWNECSVQEDVVYKRVAYTPKFTVQYKYMFSKYNFLSEVLKFSFPLYSGTVTA